MGKGGGGGGGGSSAPNYGTPPAVDFPEIDIQKILAPLVSALQTLTGTANSTPASITPPEVKNEQGLNWLEKQREVMALATQKAQAELAEKRGRASTLLTSPLVKDSPSTLKSAGTTK